MAHWWLAIHWASGMGLDAPAGSLTWEVTGGGRLDDGMVAVDLPNLKTVIFHSNFSLPEGTQKWMLLYSFYTGQS